jgi:hypothetical protein
VKIEVEELKKEIQLLDESFKNRSKRNDTFRGLIWAKKPIYLLGLYPKQMHF